MRWQKKVPSFWTGHVIWCNNLNLPELGSHCLLCIKQLLPANSAGGTCLFPSGGPLCCAGCVSGDCALWLKPPAVPAVGCDQLVWLTDWEVAILRWPQGYYTYYYLQVDSLWWVWSCYWVKTLTFSKGAQAVQCVTPLQALYGSACVARWLWTRPPPHRWCGLLYLLSTAAGGDRWSSEPTAWQPPCGTQIWLARLSPCKQPIIIHEK